MFSLLILFTFFVLLLIRLYKWTYPLNYAVLNSIPHEPFIPVLGSQLFNKSKYKLSGMIIQRHLILDVKKVILHEYEKYGSPILHKFLSQYQIIISKAEHVEALLT